MSIEYKITLKIESNMAADVCVSRKGAKWAAELKPVAWLCRPAARGHTIVFSWQETYSVYCGQKGICATDGAVSGVNFGDIVQADAVPGDAQKSAFALAYGGGLFTISPTGNGGTDKTLKLSAGGSVPSGRAFVGFGVSGKPVCAQPAYPNTPYTFDTETSFGLLYGGYEAGQILSDADIERMYPFTFSQENEAVFTLMEDNTWRQGDAFRTQGRGKNHGDKTPD
ncbi:MAG: hypothetical protein LBS00_09845 [Synergistaceae bacterium]|jgi:hypothetical protein|nr:hypothetical protein [Synergistaceae bacterium]